VDNYTIDTGLPSSNIVSVTQNIKGFILVGTTKGNVEFNGYEFTSVDNNSIKNKGKVVLPQLVKELFLHKSITCSLQDNQGSYWIGTQFNGVYYIPNYEGVRLMASDKTVLGFDLVNDSLVFQYKKRIVDTLNIIPEIKNSIGSKGVNSIKKYIDYTFVATDKGLYQFTNTNYSNYQLFTNYKGLPSNEVFDLELIYNSLYVATQKGVCKVDLNSLKNMEEQPTVLFPYVRLNNEKHLLPKGIIVVPPKYQFLTLRYLSLDYKAKGRQLYRYKIVGIHKDWVITNDTKIQFTSLPPKGEYVFEAQVQQAGGSWSASSKIDLHFPQVFYKSWWFITSSILCLLIVFGLLTKWFYKRKVTEQLLKTELSQLENKALQSQMNPHFVFNALNSIQSFITRGDTLNSEIYLAKFSNLLRKTLNYSRVDRIELSKEIESLEMYLELEKMRFGDKLMYEIIIDESIEEDFIKIPPMLLQPFVENAIIHGIAPKPNGGKIEVVLKMLNDNELYCAVIDNGVGRRETSVNIHKSLGTDIVKKRLRIIKNNTKDPIVYTDLKDDSNLPLGTKVEFIIPINA